MDINKISYPAAIAAIKRSFERDKESEAVLAWHISECIWEGSKGESGKKSLSRAKAKKIAKDVIDLIFRR